MGVGHCLVPTCSSFCNRGQDVAAAPFTCITVPSLCFAHQQKATLKPCLGKATALSTATRDSRTHRCQLSTQPAGVCTSGVWQHPWRNHKSLSQETGSQRDDLKKPSLILFSEKSIKQLFFAFQGKNGYSSLLVH